MDGGKPIVFECSRVNVLSIVQPAFDIHTRPKYHCAVQCVTECNYFMGSHPSLVAETTAECWTHLFLLLLIVDRTRGHGKPEIEQANYEA